MRPMSPELIAHDRVMGLLYLSAISFCSVLLEVSSAYSF